MLDARRHRNHIMGYRGIEDSSEERTVGFAKAALDGRQALFIFLNPSLSLPLHMDESIYLVFQLFVGGDLLDTRGLLIDARCSFGSSRQTGNCYPSDGRRQQEVDDQESIRALE